MPLAVTFWEPPAIAVDVPFYLDIYEAAKNDKKDDKPLIMATLGWAAMLTYGYRRDTPDLELAARIIAILEAEAANSRTPSTALAAKDFLHELISDKGAFLCFRRIAAGDVVARSERFGWVKLLGSAQYRDRFGALLQHGSLLLGRSEAAPELPGLGELLGEELDSVVANHVTPEKFFDDIFHTFTRQWNAKLTERLNFRWGPLSGRDWEEMESSIAFFEEKRYTGDWILKK